MNNLKTLTILTVGAVLISAAYALTLRDKDFNITVDEGTGRTVRHTINGDEGEFLLRDENRKIKAEWSGEFNLDDAGSAIGALDDEMQISVEEDDLKERIEIESRRSGTEITYYRDGDEQDASEETDAAIAALFLKFLRASGIKADERVAIMLGQGGNAAVLEEIDALQGGHALRRYTEALTSQADLTAAEIITLTQKLAIIESDHDLAGALETILENEAISEETAIALVNAASTIESDHDLRQLVEAFVERPLNQETMDVVMTLVERIESDHDLRVAAESLLENERLNAEQTAKLLDIAADKIESDHDLRLILTEAAGMILQGEAISNAWFNTYSRISSDHDQRRALEAIAGEIEGQEALLVEYRAAAAKIDSEHERERALALIGEE